MLLGIFIYEVLGDYMSSVLLGIYLGVEWLDHWVNLFKFFREWQTITSEAIPFYIPTNNVWGFSFLPILHLKWLLFVFLAVAILQIVSGISIHVF